MADTSPAAQNSQPTWLWGRRPATTAPTVEKASAKTASDPRKPKRGGIRVDALRTRSTTAATERITESVQRPQASRPAPSLRGPVAVGGLAATDACSLPARPASTPRLRSLAEPTFAPVQSLAGRQSPPAPSRDRCGHHHTPESSRPAKRHLTAYRLFHTLLDRGDRDVARNVVGTRAVQAWRR